MYMMALLVKFIVILIMVHDVASSTVGYHYKGTAFTSRTNWLCHAKNTITGKTTTAECAIACGQSATQLKSLCSAVKFEKATKTCIGCTQCNVNNTVASKPTHPLTDFNKFLVDPSYDIDINKGK